MEPKVNSKEELTSYLNSVVTILLFVLVLGLPIFFMTLTTDFFALPKQTLVGVVILISLIAFVVKTITERAFRLRRTIFDLPLLLFILSVTLSSFFAVNRLDSLISLVPFLFATLTFFVIVNFVRRENLFFWLITFLGLGGAIAAIISILSYLKVNVIPFPIAQTQSLTLFGSLLDQAVYLAILLPIAIFFVWRKNSDPSGYRKEASGLKMIIFLPVLLVVLVGFLITAYQILNPPVNPSATTAGVNAPVQRLTTLPFQIGFQTGFAAISQDTQRSIQAFLFGSGYGTFLSDYTRFKQASVNQDSTLWALAFVRSSSYALELLATTGILGIVSFLFLILRTLRNLLARSILVSNPISIPLLLSIIALFFLPVGFTVQVLFFILLALFSVYAGFNKDENKRFFDIELQLVALKKGLLNLEAYTTPFTSIPQPSRQDQKDASRILPVIFGAVVLGLVALLGFFGVRYLLSDMEFQRSLVAAAQNRGQDTYQKQVNAIVMFPYRDGYYRVFSQTNLALANSLANIQSEAASPSADAQRTIFTLIQQSINAGRAATSLAPLTSLNWQNLSSIYRSLIGFGQNAESFAIITQQQTILLDPNNPQGYITLGGIYYQLGLWENAQNQFQLAVNLKPDLANAHYNLGHALESKGDFQNALGEYEIVRSLVANQENSLTLITQEIEALQNKIQSGVAAVPEDSAIAPPASTEALNLSTPSAQLPPQEPPVEIPAPDTATQSAQ